MRVLWAVVEDLYIFATSVLFGWLRRPGSDAPQQLYLEQPAPAIPLRAPHQGAETAAAVRLPTVVNEPTATPPRNNTIAYAARMHVPVRTAPEDALDATLTTLAYGDMVMLLEAGEEWSYVAAGNKKGYVRTAELAKNAGAVYPEFKAGIENGPRDANTVRLRSVIRDEFSASTANVPLQAHEYVYYKLWRRGVRISWPDIRPRTPGTWTRILSSLSNVAVRAEPSVGSVMEVVPSEGKARLAYVEKVHPDGAIDISEVDWPDRGVYAETRLVRTEWQALAPTFIVIDNR